MSLAILFHFLCAQHVSDINISIIRGLRLCCWITTLVVVFSVCCVLDLVRLGWSGVRVAGWSLLVFYSSTITMMHSPINIRFTINVNCYIFKYISQTRVKTLFITNFYKIQQTILLDIVHVDRAVWTNLSSTLYEGMTELSRSLCSHLNSNYCTNKAWW